METSPFKFQKLFLELLPKEHPHSWMPYSLSCLVGGPPFKAASWNLTACSVTSESLNACVQASRDKIPANVLLSCPKDGGGTSCFHSCPHPIASLWSLLNLMEWCARKGWVMVGLLICHSLSRRYACFFTSKEDISTLIHWSGFCPKCPFCMGPRGWLEDEAQGWTFSFYTLVMNLSSRGT